MEILWFDEQRRPVASGLEAPQSILGQGSQHSDLDRSRKQTWNLNLKGPLVDYCPFHRASVTRRPAKENSKL